MFAKSTVWGSRTTYWRISKFGSSIFEDPWRRYHKSCNLEMAPRQSLGNLFRRTASRTWWHGKYSPQGVWEHAVGFTEVALSKDMSHHAWLAGPVSQAKLNNWWLTREESCARRTSICCAFNQTLWIKVGLMLVQWYERFEKLSHFTLSPFPLLREMS